jgi:hypothetical protein
MATPGGSGTGGDVARDSSGVPIRALDLLGRYELSVRGLVVTLLITNRSLEDVTVDLAVMIRITSGSS